MTGVPPDLRRPTLADRLQPIWANAVTAVNNNMKALFGGQCPAYPIACYSTSASDYALLGLENGQEMWGSSSYFGGSTSYLVAVMVH